MYDWPATDSKLSPKTFCADRGQLLGLLFNFLGCTSGHTRTTKCAHLQINKSLTKVFFIYLALKTNSVQLKVPLCILLPFGSPQCNNARVMS